MKKWIRHWGRAKEKFTWEKGIAPALPTSNK